MGSDSSCSMVRAGNAAEEGAAEREEMLAAAGKSSMAIFAKVSEDAAGGASAMDSGH